MKLLIFSLFISIIYHSLSALDHEKIFSTIYTEHVWGCNNENRGTSGPGSTFENTHLYRHFLQKFLEAHSITSVVDLGCGDWEFSKFINWHGINYVGLDIVEEIIENNMRQFASPSIHFRHANIVEENVPPADLLICKDVLQHLPNKDIMKISEQFPKFKYCLINNGMDLFSSSVNKDIPIGYYRPIDLTLPPFNVPGEKIFHYISGNFMMQVLLIIN